MIVLKIAKWGVIALVIAWLSLFTFFTVQDKLNPFIPIDPFNGAKEDFGEVPSGAGITYSISISMLGDTDYEAVFGGCRRDDKKGPEWDYYYIWVDRKSPVEPDSWYPFFSRWFSSEDVHSSFWTNSIENFINYDADRRFVNFELGFTNYNCKLPPKDSPDKIYQYDRYE